MLLDGERCYRALRTHDARFDGRFFVGVTSTRIYCRPVCTARAPRREHLRFFGTAAAAEAHGFRPCLRCRPELAPGNAVIDAPRSLATRAAGLIEDGALADGRSLDELAARLGVTARHLRRVFQAEFGVSPIEFSQTQRLLLAKRLLTDTRLPVVDIAMASGFASLRRFNALCKARYRLAPSDLRKRAESRLARDGFHFLLRFEKPFDWSALLRFLGHRSVNGCEEVEGSCYRRTVRLTHRGRTHVGWITATRAVGRDAIDLCVSASLARVLPQIVGRVKRLFDLACPIRDVESALGALAERRPGLRVPGAFDGFETAVRAILGQQVTVKHASALAGRVAQAFGDSVDTPFSALDRVFPPAARVAELAPSAIAAIGVLPARSRAMIDLARAVADGAVVLEPGVDLEATLAALCRIPGIGDWTAQYVAMRALAWPDAFPDTDIGLMKAMAERRRGRLRERAQAWRPWRAYAVMHLWATLDAYETAVTSRPSSAN